MRPILYGCLLVLVCRSAAAQCCDHCGCQSRCRKVCRVVCEVKKVPKITYDCECEEICIPGPSCRTTVCDDCGNKRHVYTPTCGKVKTRTKLVKHETFEEKVTYKWVVERLCDGCETRCAQARSEVSKRFGPDGAERIPSTVDESPALLTGYAQSALPEDAPGVPEMEQNKKNAGDTDRRFFDLNRILRPLRD